MAHANIQLRQETLLDPELLEFNLPALFNLLLEFSRFLKFSFDCCSGAGVLELYLTLHGPSFAEIIAKINHGMRDVEAAVAGCVAVVVGLGVDIRRIVIEIAGHGYFSVASHSKSVVLCTGSRAAEGKRCKSADHPFCHNQVLLSILRRKITDLHRAGQSQ